MMGTPGARPTPESYDAEIEVNCRVATRLTVAALQVMIPAAHASKSRRGIMATGSLVYMGAPLMSIYGGTKAYLHQYYRAVHTELLQAGHPIDVTMYHPGPTVTKMVDDLCECRRAPLCGCFGAAPLTP